MGLLPTHVSVPLGDQRNAVPLRAAIPLLPDLPALSAQRRLLHVGLTERAGDTIHDLVSLAPQLYLDECLGQVPGIASVPEDKSCPGAHEALPGDRSGRRVRIVGVAALQALWFVIDQYHTSGAAGTRLVGDPCPGGGDWG